MSSLNNLPWAIIGGTQTATSYYSSRNAARDANKSIKGKITANKLADAAVTAEAMVAEQPSHAAEVVAAEAAIEAAQAPNPFERLGALATLEAPKLSAAAKEPAKCVACGSLNLFSGQVNETTGIVEFEEYILGCHDCGHVIDTRAVAAKSAKEKKEKRIVDKVNFSTVERPTKAVWHIADELKAAGVTARKEVIAECERRGIAFYTARTQYQSWFKCQKEMSEREAAEAAADFKKMASAAE